MARLEPNQGIGIEQDQRRSLALLLKRNPSGFHSHCHMPLATAGSTISMTGLRRVFFDIVWRSGCTRNRTPRRSMTTDSPRSAASSRRENRCFAVAVVNRFMADTILFSGALAKHACGDGVCSVHLNVPTPRPRRLSGASVRFAGPPPSYYFNPPPFSFSVGVRKLMAHSVANIRCLWVNSITKIDES